MSGADAGLIGRPGSRWQLATPALVLDLDRLEANLARIAAFARQQGIALRPHAKSHKCVEIARRQISAGALGVCCATLGEAEAMAAAGIAQILLTSPVAGSAKIARLAALRQLAEGLMAVCDDDAVATALDRAAAAEGPPLRLLIDVDIGHGRTGVRGANAAVSLAQQIAAAKHLDFAGVQAYGGHLQHLADPAKRAAAAREAAERLRAVVDALKRVGLAPPIVTGAGTGTFEIDTEIGLYTELQAGSYVFMDVQYADPALWSQAGPPFAAALFVQTTVVSANVPGQVTTDAGLKAFATDGPPPLIARGAPAGATYRFTGDEFGCITLPPGATLPLGAVVECVVPHCDPTVNLHDWYHCVRGDELVAIWPVDARGKY